MRIEERLTRRSPDDIIFIGNLIQNAMRSDFWVVLQMLSSSLKVEEIEKSKTGIGGPISSDRVLGRIEAYETLTSNLEAFVTMKEELSKPLTQKKESPEDGAEEIIDREEVEPVSLKYGGAM